MSPINVDFVLISGLCLRKIDIVRAKYEPLNYTVMLSRMMPIREPLIIRKKCLRSDCWQFVAWEWNEYGLEKKEKSEEECRRENCGQVQNECEFQLILLYEWMNLFRFSRCIIWLNQIDRGASEYWSVVYFIHLFWCSSKSVMHSTLQIGESV